MKADVYKESVMPIYMKIEGVRGTFDLAETDTLVFTGDDTGERKLPGPLRG